MVSASGVMQAMGHLLTKYWNREVTFGDATKRTGTE